MSNSTIEQLNTNSRFINAWENMLQSTLQMAQNHGVVTLARVNLVRVEEEELELRRDVKTIADTRVIVPVSEELREKSYVLTEESAMLTVIESLGWGLDYGDSSNNVLGFDSIAHYIPKNNLARLIEKSSAKDWQLFSNEELLAVAKSKFNLNSKDIKTIVRPDYRSMLYTESPTTGKFLLSTQPSLENITVYYSVKRIERPVQSDQGTTFSVVLSAVLNVENPEDIYVLQAPFRFKE